MARGIQGKEPDARTVYADIIDLPHHQSPVRPHMSLYDRAAQFAPFAALTGYDDMIDEEARLVDNKIELNEEELEELNRQLARLNEQAAEGLHPKAAITFFIPDLLKSGGSYVTITDTVRKVDAVNGVLIMDKKTGTAGMNMEIRLQNILEISLPE